MRLELRNVDKVFGTKTAVDHVNMVLTRGVCGLLGANGAGKTTLMRMICGIMVPSDGEILWNGKRIQDLDEQYRKILGYLPQEFGYYPEFSAVDYLLYIAALKGLKPVYAKKRVQELLELVNLWSARKKKVKTFSGGMKRRLGIAQAMLNNPKILVLDEPTAGLDPKERIRFRNLVSELGKDRLILLSTHIVSDVEYIANRIFVMKEGQIAAEGSVDDLITQVAGCVWKCTVLPNEAARLENSYNICNVKAVGQKIELRILSEELPHPQAHAVTPVLEDVFMRYFGKAGEYDAV